MLPKAFEGRTACCFTGHRPQGLPDGGAENGQAFWELKHRLLHCVEEAVLCGVTRFYAGGAEGFDTLAAESVLVWKKRYYPQLKLTLALPSNTQAQGYSPAMRERYERILASADEVYYASKNSNGPYALLARNRYMVEHADCCIAYLNNMSGGTLYTVNYALERGIPVYNLAYGDKS